jgi:hypothetical protein
MLIVMDRQTKAGKQQQKSSAPVCAEDVVMRPKDWLWRGHLLRGAQELFAGIPGIGKSQAQCDRVARWVRSLPKAPSNAEDAPRNGSQYSGCKASSPRLTQRAAVERAFACAEASKDDASAASYVRGGPSRGLPAGAETGPPETLEGSAVAGDGGDA